MLKTYRFRLHPNQKQEETLNWITNQCRWLYNTMLEQRRFAYQKRGISLTYTHQANELPQLKRELPHFKKIPSQSLQDVARRLDKAFQAFFRRLQTNRKAGFPRFQGKNRYNSFTYPQSGFALNGAFLKLSKVGDVRIKCHRQIKGTLKTCTLCRKNDKRYACFACEVETQPQSTTNQEIGIDLGVHHLAITSDGQFYDNPRFLKQSEKKIRYLNKILSRRKKGSNRRNKAKQQLTKAYEQLANRRNDRTHKVSRKLVDQYNLMAFEDLNIQGMVRNKSLSKHILDTMWHSLVQYTAYKAEEAGKCVVQVNPQNTSQECSGCHQLVPKELSERKHKCPHCGYSAHRDVNAAQNILSRAKEQRQTAS